MPNTRFNPQEALVCAMVLMAASDQQMSDSELMMMSRLVQELPAFANFHPSEISRVTEICLGLLERTDGLDEERIGVSVASGIGGLNTLVSQWDIQKGKGLRRVSPFTIPMLISNAPAANLVRSSSSGLACAAGSAPGRHR